MGVVLDLAEKYWRGEVPASEHHPFAPMMALEEIVPGVAFVSSFANVTAIRTEAGLVLIDTGSFFLSAQVHRDVRNWSDKSVHTVVFTHGHVDHVFGLERYESEARDRGHPIPRVIAHRAVPERFDRYKRSPGYNSCINARQFRWSAHWPVDYRYPDKVYDGSLDVDVGELRMELHHSRGETDDHTWVWIPSHAVLCTGDLFIWATPNAGNPQKVQRYPREWALALRQMHALSPQVLLPGHGVPIVGRERVAQALSETAELLESLHDQTLALMNQGASLDEVIHTVRAPSRLLDRPYLRPVYDEPEFIVRNIWRSYGGWYDGNPAHLKPAPYRTLSHEIAELAGGAERLAHRANMLADLGDLDLAAHLIEMAAHAAPTDSSIAKIRARVYQQRSEQETSLMARNIFRSAAEHSPGGRRKTRR
jgi:alkyl sulfatase BDS1-like metallo-beta-lactamase superfamily hydrolase